MNGILRLKKSRFAAEDENHKKEAKRDYYKSAQRNRTAGALHSLSGTP
jgi:hypothetical protein